MRNLAVIQHTESEYLGLIEDHFEGRNIRFQYIRPFLGMDKLPGEAVGDGLVLLGAGPYGVVSGHILPSLSRELRLTTAYLEAGLPVLAFGLGAVILSVAAGGGAQESELDFALQHAKATASGHLQGHLPASLPLACYLRDKPILSPNAEVLAINEKAEPLIFSVGKHALGFLGHPGMKRGMIEDLIMEFEQTPDDCITPLEALGAAQQEIAEKLTPLMVGVVAHAGWM